MPCGWRPLMNAAKLLFGFPCGFLYAIRAKSGEMYPACAGWPVAAPVGRIDQNAWPAAHSKPGCTLAAPVAGRHPKGIGRTGCQPVQKQAVRWCREPMHARELLEAGASP